MMSCGITKRFPISLHRPFLRVTNSQKKHWNPNEIHHVLWAVFINFSIQL